MPGPNKDRACRQERRRGHPPALHRGLPGRSQLDPEDLAPPPRRQSFTGPRRGGFRFFLAMPPRRIRGMCGAYWFIHTSSYQFIPVRTSSYQFVPVRTSSYQFVPVHTSSYQFIHTRPAGPVYMNWYVLNGKGISQPTLPYPPSFYTTDGTH